VTAERQNTRKTSEANSPSSCDERICPTFEVRKYLQRLRQDIPYVPPIDLAPLERLHKAHDHKGMAQLIKRLMNIEDVTFQIFWVPDGAAKEQKDAAAWVELPSDMPFYRSKEFKEMTIKMFFRKSFFQQSCDHAAFVVAHEFSHVVLESIRHPLRKCEKAVDMTAMILGFGRVVESICHTVRQVGDQIEIRTLGYLNQGEVWEVNQLLLESKQQANRAPSKPSSDFIPRTKIWNEKPTTAIFLGIGLFLTAGAWFLGTKSIWPYDGQARTSPTRTVLQKCATRRLGEPPNSHYSTSDRKKSCRTETPNSTALSSWPTRWCLGW
jgi:hypothetical protein